MIACKTHTNFGQHSLTRSEKFLRFCQPKILKTCVICWQNILVLPDYILMKLFFMKLYIHNAFMGAWILGFLHYFANIE